VLHKFLVSMVKKLFKSVHIYRSYHQNKPGGPFFWTTWYVTTHFSYRYSRSWWTLLKLCL